jgi:hypothetical protein
MARRWRSQPQLALLHLAALAAVGCTYDWLGVEPSSSSAGTGGVDPAGGMGGEIGGAEVGGSQVAGAGGGSAAGGTPSSGGRGGASTGGGGVSGGATGGGGGAPGGAGGLSGGGARGDGGGTGGDEVCPGNVVSNPGFENGIDGWDELVEEGGSRGTFAVTSDVVSSGTGALSIDATKVSPPTAADYRLVIASSPIQVAPGETLSLSAQIGAVPGNYGLPAAGLQFFDLAGDPLPGLPALTEVTSPSVAPFELQATAPGASATVRVIFEVRNEVLLLADDVCLLREP